MSIPAVSTIQLQCFVRIVEIGSFAGAARELGLSTSGVSKTIARLERAKGVRLLNRSTHSLSLTQEGERLIEPARDAVGAMERAEAAFTVAAREGTIGRVRLGAPTAFLRACLAPMLPALFAAHPDIVLDLRGSDELVDLAEAGLDIVLRTGSTDGVPGHLQQALLSFRWVTCAAPVYLAEHAEPTSPAELVGHRIVAFRNQRTGLVDPWRYRGDGGAMSSRWLPPPAAVLDDANAVAEAAVAGAGIVWPRIG